MTKGEADPDGEDEVTRERRERHNQRIEASEAKRKKEKHARKRPN
jgi:hypothetical protein